MIFTKNRLAAFARILPAIALGTIVSTNPDLVQAAVDFGGSDAVLDESCGLLVLIKDWLFNICYILGAIGLVVIAVSAFLGKFKFAHLIALGGGLFIVAVADMLIDFITGSTGDTTCSTSSVSGVMDT